MKYLICAICAIIISLAFGIHKCEHVFTEVEQAAIKVEQPAAIGGQGYYSYSRPTGLHEGKDLICVKCFYKQKQIIDYGKPQLQGFSFTQIGIGDNPCDSLHVFGAILSIKGDSSYRVKYKAQPYGAELMRD